MPRTPKLNCERLDGRDSLSLVNLLCIDEEESIQNLAIGKHSGISDLQREYGRAPLLHCPAERIQTIDGKISSRDQIIYQ